MTQSTSQGIGLAYAIQAAKGTPITAGASFKKVRVNTANLGAQQGIGRFPIEVGGTYHPGGSFKQWYAGAGNVTWAPRLEGDIGYLLYMLMGSAASSGSALADSVYQTTFRPRTDFCNHPWMTIRRFIPNCVAGQEQGEYLGDAKMSAMQLTLGAGDPAAMSMSFLALDTGSASDASDWDTAMTAEYEDTDSVILASASSSPIFKAISGIDLGDGVGADFSIPTIGFQLVVANQFSADGIRPELVVGSQQPDDAVLLGQTATFQITYKWKDPKLYRAIYNYGHASYAWSPTIAKTTVEFEMKSPQLAGVSATQYETLKLSLTRCGLECPQGITLTGGGFLSMIVTGQAETQQTAEEYMTAVLTNSKDYTDLGVSYS